MYPATRLDNAPADHARRRIWCHPELASHSVLILTPERLYLDPIGGRPTPSAEAIRAVQAGADPNALLGPAAEGIELIAVNRLKLDLTANTLSIEYLVGGHQTATRTIAFTTPEAADGCFTALWRSVGDGLRLVPFRRSSWELARAPLTLLVGSLVVTAVLVLLLSIFADFAAARSVSRGADRGWADLGTVSAIPQTPLELLLSWLDWRLVCAIGGAVAAASQVWLYRRLTDPPARLEVART